VVQGRPIQGGEENGGKLIVCVDPVVENWEYKLAKHSKNYATTHRRTRDMPKDFMNYQACWKNKRMQAIYANTVLPWLDIKAVLVLCFGSICKYKLIDSANMSDDWLAVHVCLGISQCFCLRVATIFAKPFLRASMDAEWSNYVS
jgi:hypothetical protein